MLRLSKQSPRDKIQATYAQATRELNSFCLCLYAWLEEIDCLLADPAAREFLSRAYFGNAGDRGPFQQLLNRDGESSRKDIKHGQGGVGFTSFYPTHVGPEHTATLCKLFLGDAAFRTQFAYSQSQGLLNIDGRLWHP